MTGRLAIPALLAALLLAAAPAHARCQGAVMLGGVHDAYLAMLQETGEQRTLAATTLLVLSGRDGGGVFAARLARAGVEVSSDRLATVLDEGRELARDILAGGEPPKGLSRHSRNATWLGDAYIQTGCRNVLVATGASGSSLSGAGDGISPTAGTFVEENEDLIRLALGVLGSVAATCAIAWAVRRVVRSVAFRRRRVERQPRTPVSFETEVAFADETRRVRALDISPGGMKLDWSGAPATGTELSLALPTARHRATVMWSNAYYAGVMFDAFLDEDELKALCNRK